MRMRVMRSVAGLNGRLSRYDRSSLASAAASAGGVLS
jgi:hypothetical protein